MCVAIIYAHSGVQCKLKPSGHNQHQGNGYLNDLIFLCGWLWAESFGSCQSTHEYLTKRQKILSIYLWQKRRTINKPASKESAVTYPPQKTDPFHFVACSPILDPEKKQVHHFLRGMGGKETSIKKTIHDIRAACSASLNHLEPCYSADRRMARDTITIK